MTTAIITPLRTGEAVLDLDGVPAKFSSWRAAADEADAQRRPWWLDRFPSPSVDSLP